MTALPSPDPTQAAYERGFVAGARFTAGEAIARLYSPEAATTARNILGGLDMRSLIAGIAIGALLMAGLFSAVGLAAAHDITSANVSCANQTSTITGTGFEKGNSPVTVTGPGGYSQTFSTLEPDWTQVLPLGPNGSYHVDWPGAGTHAFTFTVECAAPPTPTPTPRDMSPPSATTPPEVTPSPTPSPSPTPVVTPAPTPTGTVAAATGTPKPHVTLPPTDSE